ncbi:unnamed protein product [Gongylonema pulchrum]|uniref:C3H1-type domain-containing protein n=1 Tax=Gongylonema pulchrum TaxID=637853 RepID=A0A183EK59_9BILA|nr:unnamed protein product [Gongylonema pulchrum]
MIIEAPEALRAWLTKEMAPICDAEPGAIAKYVLALLRKDKPEPELMEFCIEQLDVFLQSSQLFFDLSFRLLFANCHTIFTEAKSFVERLFRVIKERSYIGPVTSSVATVSAVPAKESGTAHEKKKDIDERREVKEKEKEKREDLRKKSISASDKEKEQQKFGKVRDERETEKIAVAAEPAAVQPQKPVRKRISPPPNVSARDDSRRDHAAPRFERRRSRSPRDRRLERPDRNLDRRVQLPPARLQYRQMDRYKSERPDRLERKRSRSPYDRPRREKSTEPEMRKKKRCRDYDEKGYCMKGDQCMFDHGPDPVVVDDIALEKMVTNGAKPAVTHLTPNFSVPPPGYTPLNPPPPGVDSVYATNSRTVAPAASLSEGYNPEAPALSAPSLPLVAAPAAAPSMDFSVPPPPLPTAVPNQAWRPTNYTVPPASSVLIHPTTNVYDPTQSAITAPSPNVTQVSFFFTILKLKILGNECSYGAFPCLSGGFFHIIVAGQLKLVVLVTT